MKEIEISTRMDYTVEVAQHWRSTDYNQHKGQTSVDYHYHIELNADGEIIGGQWLEMDRPDFLWKREIPVFTDSYLGIETLYQASIRAKNND